MPQNRRFYNRRFYQWINDYVLPTGIALLFLGLWIKSHSVDLAEHNRYVSALRQLQEQDARINQNLLQLRLGLLNNYDSMVRKQAGIWALHKALAVPPRFVGANRQQIEAQVQASQQLWQEKNALIEQFNSRKSVLENSLAYFPMAVKGLSDDSAIAPKIAPEITPEITPEIATRLNALLRDVLLFNLSATEETVSKVRLDIEQINRLSRDADSDVTSLLTHASIILEKSLETDELVEQALRMPTRQQGRALAETYDSTYQQSVRAASLHRFGLYLLLTGLVIAIAASTIFKLRAAAAAQQVANQAKSQFLSNMSHELRTPLNVILGFTQLMARDRSLDLHQQDYLSSINQSGEHLLSLINDVLEMSKIEAGKVSLNSHDFDLYGLLEGIHTMFQFKAHSKGLALTLHKAESLPQYVFTDESKLRQVLVNLVGNAVKFTHSGGIQLRVQADEPSVSAREAQESSLSEQDYGQNHEQNAEQSSVTLHFEIEDTGPGVSAEDIEVLFDPFIQAKNQALHPGGTGLGLPISRRFVEMMGGEISLSSEVGIGSQFVFSVKVGTARERDVLSPNGQRQVVGLVANQPEYRLLVVEDMPKSRQLLIDLLSPVGFEIKEAANGLEAVNICQLWKPDLIWMDMRMPVMDGYEATRQIRSDVNGHRPVIIALTGNAFVSEQRRAIAAGCDDFISKPFRTAVIFEKMTEHLGVRYTYCEEGLSAIAAMSAQAPFPQVTAKDLQAVSDDWIAQMHQAATKVNGRDIAQLLEELPPEQSALKLAFNQLLETFSFEEIVKLTRNRSQ